MSRLYKLAGQIRATTNRPPLPSPSLPPCTSSAGPAQLALDDVCDRRLAQRAARGLGGVGEDPRGIAPEGAVEQLDDLEHADRGRVAREAIAALDAALGAHDARAPQDGEELLEELHGHATPARELADGNRL